MQRKANLEAGLSCDLFNYQKIATQARSYSALSKRRA